MIFCGIRQEIGLRPRMEDVRAIRDLSEKNFSSKKVYDGHLGYRSAQIFSEDLTP
ncbi:MAG: hypothetical protein LUQ38_06175 [Methanotrichaceae archaeon]|nr:hypothetical protein [Methanotrichaceae archaeon]